MVHSYRRATFLGRCTQFHWDDCWWTRAGPAIVGGWRFFDAKKNLHSFQGTLLWFLGIRQKHRLSSTQVTIRFSWFSKLLSRLPKWLPTETESFSLRGVQSRKTHKRLSLLSGNDKQKTAALFRSNDTPLCPVLILEEFHEWHSEKHEFETPVHCVNSVTSENDAPELHVCVLSNSVMDSQLNSVPNLKQKECRRRKHRNLKQHTFFGRCCVNHKISLGVFPKMIGFTTATLCVMVFGAKAANLVLSTCSCGNLCTWALWCLKLWGQSDVNALSR